MEIYIGSYIIIPRETTTKDVCYYVCPTDEKHHKTSYENAKFCSTCGKEIVKKTTQEERYVNNQKIETINDPKIRIPMYFSMSNVMYDCWAAYSHDDGQLYFDETSCEGCYIKRTQITMEDLMNAEKAFVEEYKTFIKFLDDNEIKYTVETGVLIN